MKKLLTTFALAVLMLTAASAQNYILNDKGYFTNGRVDAMAFDDYYPEGHQGGIAVIMHGKRVVTNGDLRFEPTPGQWQPVPKKVGREVKDGSIVTFLEYPDTSRHMTGFNPMIYPDCHLTYSVTLTPQGKGFLVTVDLDQPVPEAFQGKVGFNLEFFPGELFGKPWIMDDKSGIFPQQANGPLETASSYTEHSWPYRHEGKLQPDVDLLNGPDAYSPYTADTIVAEPYAVGSSFTSRPDDPLSRITVKVMNGEPLRLYDGRLNHNNGWFVLRSVVPAGATKGAIKWYIEPNVVSDWIYKPVVQTSQVGYAPAQQKVAVIETDRRDTALPTASLFRYTAEGETLAKTVEVKKWDGEFLRYDYLLADFSDVVEPGMYVLRYGDSSSPCFRIDSDVYDRGVWQPVIEYFLPVQMCHMRVRDKYRVWHDRCHMDDADMALEGNYVDGYVQAPGIPCKLQPGEAAHGLNAGGWHDAGDFDLRIESQIGESYILSMAWENFHPQIDVTTIDQKAHDVEIHQADGADDILQQIEHGALTVVNGYLALGRPYRGIITHTLRQYVMLGDASAMTDGIPGNDDDRWVFTENNPFRDLSTAYYLAGTARVLKQHNDTLAAHCLAIAREMFDNLQEPERFRGMGMKAQPAAELYLTTGEQQYLDYLLANWDAVCRGVERTGWCTARVAKMLEGNKKYKKQVAAYRAALLGYRDKLTEQTSQTPYGVPYRPDIWGAGWTIQNFGFNHWFLVDAYPDIFDPAPVFNALNFVLGCHPGVNQQSFASGVGSQSATVGYGLNRADWSYIPGGVVSGTALIRPDFPELLVWPYLWQQVEYVLGGGSSHYMFLVLAAQSLLK